MDTQIPDRFRGLSQLPLRQEEKKCAFGSERGLSNQETRDSHTAVVSKWAFSKTPFSLSSRTREEKSERG